MTALDRLRTVPGWLDTHLAPLRSSLPYRAYTRYAAARGNVLAGGIAYFAFFSIFPALAIGFTVFAYVLGSREDLQAQVVQYINESLGVTVIGYHEGQQGVVTIDQLVQSDVLTTSGLIGLVTLLLTGLGWISALRDGIQAVFATRERVNPVVLKLFDVVLFGVAGLAALASVVTSVAVSVAGARVLHLLGWSDGVVARWTVTILGQLVLVVIDAAVFTLMFARLNGAGVPVRDVLSGAALAAVGFSGMKLFASEVLRSVAHNRFLATFGIVVGLLVWMNLAARLILLAAAWSATVASDRGHLRTPDPAGLAGRPASPAADPSPAVTTPVAEGRDVGARARRPSPMVLLVGFLAGAIVHRCVSACRRRHRGRRPAGR
ncbi:MAG TPA: YihY/virulence factor BrkB family protein [Kineosporiaceae bacterium]|nr:YihY/virulence factor BrkB family protein [Kineosporiaceae bacterium]